jgi:tetratricopeptide (TPR) repeat protein
LRLRRYPDDIEALKNLGTCLARTGQLAAAYEAQQKVLSVQPDNFGAWDSMAMVCSGLGLREEARKAGEQSLALKDALSNGQHAPWALPSGSAADFATQTGKTPVISFSLWGNLAEKVVEIGCRNCDGHRQAARP